MIYAMGIIKILFLVLCVAAASCAFVIQGAGKGNQTYSHVRSAPPGPAAPTMEPTVVPKE